MLGGYGDLDDWKIDVWESVGGGESWGVDLCGIGKWEVVRGWEIWGEYKVIFKAVCKETSYVQDLKIGRGGPVFATPQERI